MLLAVMLTLSLMLVALAIEAPRIAQQIKREKEEELVHRGKDYATAVKRFVHKNGGRYPLSIEQLEDTNHVRFLRKRYKDPITGEADWRLVHVGEAQINIPVPNPGLSPGNAIAPTNPGLGAGTNTPPTGIAQTLPPGSQPGQTAPPQPGTGQLGSLTTTGQTIGGGQIIGVASVSKGQSIKEFNDKDHYDEWFFVYDLKLEQSGGPGVAIAAPRGSTGSTTGAPETQPPPSAPGQPTPAPMPPQVPN